MREHKAMAPHSFENISILSAWLLCAAVVLSFLALQYQEYISNQRVLEHIDVFDPLMWIGTLAAICPAFVVLIFRRFWFVVAICAIPILVLFVARCYFLWQLKATGVNSVSIYQKGDWAIWFHMLLSGVSGVVLFCGLMGYLIILSSKYRMGGNK
jgi:hypothetical protein